MVALLCFLLRLLGSLFKSTSRLRQQLIVLRRKVRGRIQFTNGDRLLLIQLYRWFPSILKAVMIIRPETLVRWHRAGFRRYWRWKSRNPGGRPRIDAGLRALIRQMSIENWLWGAPRVQANCSGSALRSRSRPLPSTWPREVSRLARPGAPLWRNHAPRIAAMDLFVVPTIS